LEFAEMQMQFAMGYVTPLLRAPAEQGNNHVADKL
jgi:hypothetical protein